MAAWSRSSFWYVCVSNEEKIFTIIEFELGREGEMSLFTASIHNNVVLQRRLVAVHFNYNSWQKVASCVVWC